MQLLGNGGGGHVHDLGRGIDPGLREREGITEGEIAVQGVEGNLSGEVGVAIGSLAAGGVEVTGIGDPSVLLGAGFADHPQVQMKVSLLHQYRDLGAVPAGGGGASGGDALHRYGMVEGDLSAQDRQGRGGLLGGGLAHKGGEGISGTQGELDCDLSPTLYRTVQRRGLGDHDPTLGADHPGLTLGGGEKYLVLQGHGFTQPLVDPPRLGDGCQGFRCGVLLPGLAAYGAFPVWTYPCPHAAADIEPSGSRHPSQGDVREQVTEAGHGLSKFDISSITIFKT